MKNNLILLYCFLLLIIPQCGSFRAKKEFQYIQEKTEENLNHSINWLTSDQLVKDDLDLEKEIAHGLSLKRAIGIALNFDPELQADFETLGISKADLVQAGLYSNPQFDGTFELAQRPPNKADLTWQLSVAISDLWQVPLRKKVAQDELEIVTKRILNRILQVFTRTKMAYTTALAKRQLYLSSIEAYQQGEILRDRIYYRKEFGYETDLDGYLADAMVDRLHVDVVTFKKEVYTAFSNLRRTLGLKPSEKLIPLTETFDILKVVIPQKKELVTYLLDFHPLLKIAQLKIVQAQHMVSYERSRFIKEFRVGISYERENDGSIDRGPIVGFDIPLFDTNSAQIERAKFLLKQAKKEYMGLRHDAVERLINHYNNLMALLFEIPMHKSIINSYEKAINYSKRWSKTKQLERTILMQNRLDLHEETKKLINAQLNALKELALLEEIVGTTIPVTRKDLK